MFDDNNLIKIIILLSVVLLFGLICLFFYNNDSEYSKETIKDENDIKKKKSEPIEKRKYSISHWSEIEESSTTKKTPELLKTTLKEAYKDFGIMDIIKNLHSTSRLIFLVTGLFLTVNDLFNFLKIKKE